jgi:hypothetical protein
MLQAAGRRRSLAITDPEPIRRSVRGPPKSMGREIATARWPVVDPPHARTVDGDAIGMETFFIACAKAMGLPGFGAGALKDAAGTPLPLDRPTDWYLRAAANVDFAGQKPVPDATDEDIALTGLDRWAPLLQTALKPDEWRKAAHVFSRGGRFQPVGQAYQGEQMATKFPRALNIYNEQVAVSRSAMTGRRFAGMPQWIAPSFADGTPMWDHFAQGDWPMLMCSQKSVLLNSYSIGLDRLRGIHVDNPVSLHAGDAAKLGLRNGDRVRITTPGGSVLATALVRKGIMRGAIAVEHGYGHKETRCTRAPHRPDATARQTCPGSRDQPQRSGHPRSHPLRLHYLARPGRRHGRPPGPSGAAGAGMTPCAECRANHMAAAACRLRLHSCRRRDAMRTFPLRTILASPLWRSLLSGQRFTARRDAICDMKASSIAARTATMMPMTTFTRIAVVHRRFNPAPRTSTVPTLK